MKRAVLTVLTTLLAGCGAVGMPHAALQAGAMEAAAKKGGYQLLVMPDMGVGSVVAQLKAAKKAIHMEMYMITPKNDSGLVLDTLCERAKAGVDVSVILDGSVNDFPQPPSCEKPTNPLKRNQFAFDALSAAGAKVKWSNPAFRFTHQKSVWIDGQTALIMTMNMSTSAFRFNREYVIVDRVPAEVAEVGKIFDADWNNAAYTPSRPDFVVSPVNSRAQILKLIDSAKKTLVYQVEFLSDKEMAEHLAARVKAGVEVTAMMSAQMKDPCSGNDSNAQTTALMASIGITKFAFTHKVTMHAKAIVVDDQRAYIGSENFTANSLNNNRELGLVTDDATLVKPLIKVMAQDWAERDQPAPPHLAVD
ncbi:MAG: hypothetical protein JWM80_1866 [Cyanobacteria bacterium RYN_339]|nr:hypothetical protein [Cyanobacteria bacterium RYN_339]